MRIIKNNLKTICGTIIGIMIGGLSVVAANQAIQAVQNDQIKISLNGQVQIFKDETTGEIQYPITYNNRTYLPLRNVAELSGLNVDYDSNTNTAILTNQSNKPLYNSIDDYNKLVGVREVNYDSWVLPKNILLNARLTKKDGKVVLTADVGNPYAFSREEINKVVDELENSDAKEAQLGPYTVHKDYIEGFYRWYVEDFTLDSEFVDSSFDKTKWYNEDRIPFYITDSNNSFVRLEFKENRYYPYWDGVPVGKVALVDNIDKNAFELVLNDNDKIVSYEANGYYEYTYMVKDLSNDDINSIRGISIYNSDSFEIVDGVIRICTANGDGL